MVTKAGAEPEQFRQTDVRVSVVMPVYNGEAYIRQQLDSILMQLAQTDELVISDDGSTDSTPSIIKSYQSEDRRIRLLKGPGQGIKKNVEHALKNTRGQYIFLADQDDIWVEGKLEHVLQTLEAGQASVVVHDARVFTGEDSADVWMESFFAFRGSGAGVVKNIIKNTYIGCCMAFRRELLPVVLPIPAQIEMHDQWIGVLSDHYAGKSCFLPEKLLLYRRHGANNSSMEHYGPCRMIRNRLVFLWYFCGRILQNRQKRGGNLVKFNKNDS